MGYSHPALHRQYEEDGGVARCRSKPSGEFDLSAFLHPSPNLLAYRNASDSIVGKAICRTVVAFVGLDSHSSAQLGLHLLSLSRSTWADMAEMEATMTWNAQFRAPMLDELKTENPLAPLKEDSHATSSCDDAQG